ncbi:unnamed protein product [Brassica napus]|uniref:(rape) hypothetical protein n=1 Tax=Brassica napus TaxID=3708 RepID=A0A817AWH1_BRANA|nr:unnamed protein product [Brassica napus]
MSILCAVSYTDFSSILPSLLANVDSEAEMKGTEASHHKLSNGSSSINLNITSSPIEGDGCSGRPTYDVRGSPFSHNKIGQYFYLVATGCGFALSILFIFAYLMVSLCSSNTLRSKDRFSLSKPLEMVSNHKLLAMPVRLEQKDNVDALVQKKRGELRKTRTGSTDLHRQGTVSASNKWRFKRISVISCLLQRQTEENTK